MKKAVFCAVMMLAATVLLTGCGMKEYKRIALESGAANVTDASQPEIRIGGEGDGDVTAAGIVIETEPVTAEPGGAENPPGGGTGQSGSNGGAAGDTLLFGGDVLLSNHVLNAYEKAGGIHGVLDEGYRSIIRDAGFFMVNEEFPFSSRGVRAEDKEYTFRLEPERVSLFREMEIDGVTLANNHALDFGVEALLDTADILDGAGILHTGAGANLSEARKPVETELDGRQIAIIGATRVIPESTWAAGKNHPGMLSSYDATALLEEVRNQKENGKFVIVYVHWGIEKDEKPQDYQRNLGQQYINAGADLVIGAHPHVLQGIEYYKGKPIVYSLGNFVFGSSIPRTMLLEVTIKDGRQNVAEERGAGLSAAGESAAGESGAGQSATGESGAGPEAGSPAVRLRLIPGTSGAGYTRMLTDAAKLQEFYQYMESISFGVSFAEDGTVILQQ